MAADHALLHRVRCLATQSHWWLGTDDPRDERYKTALDRPEDGPLKIYPVSTLVNSPKIDAPPLP
jgi:hypothetical protein